MNLIFLWKEFTEQIKHKKDVMVKLTPDLAKILNSTTGDAPSQSMQVVRTSQQNTGQKINLLTVCHVICSMIQVVLS